MPIFYLPIQIFNLKYLVANHLHTMTTGARPSAFHNPEYYSTHNPPPYTELDYSDYAPQTVRLIQQQQQTQPHMHPSYPVWTPPSATQPSNFTPTPYAQSVMHQAMPSQAYPTPPPQSSAPIFNNPASSSLAFALGHPPQQFVTDFVDNRAEQIQQRTLRVHSTPTKRKSRDQLEHESPSKRRDFPSTPSSVGPSVPVTPSSAGTTTPHRRKLIPYVDVPPKPWLTPSRSSLSATPGSRRTGDRDERTAAEKLSAYLEDVFEAEDSLPADPTDDEIPADFFVPSPSGPLPCPKLIRKVTKLISLVARPTKRLNASPRKGGGGTESVDRESVVRILRLLERAIRDAQDLEPFPQPPSKPPSPQKKGKTHAHEEDEEKEKEIDLDGLTTKINSINLSTLAVECSLCLLLHSGHAGLLSEELLSACLGAIKASLEKVVYPFVEACAHHELNPVLVALANTKSSDAEKVRRVIGEAFMGASAALPRITSLVNSTDKGGQSVLSEGLIISSVYVAIAPFFVASAEEDGERGKGKERETVLTRTLGKSAMRSLRLDALGLIRSVRRLFLSAFIHFMERFGNRYSLIIKNNGLGSSKRSFPICLN